MMRVIKWLVILLVILIIIAAIGAYAAINYAKSDKFKSDIIAEVKKETGRDLNIGGDLNLSFYPWAGVDLEQVSLSNAEGFKDQPFLKADRVALRIKTLPLLKEQYELDTLRVHGLELNLEKNKDGKTNWDDFVEESYDDDDDHHENGGGAMGVAGVILGGVDVKESRVTWSDATTGQEVVLSEINASTAELNFGDPIELVATLKAKANQPAISSDVKLNGTLQYDLDEEIYSAKPFNVVSTLKGKNIPGGTADVTFDTALVVDMDKETATLEGLDLKALGTQLQATMNATELDDDPKVDGQFQLQGDSLARLFKVLELEPMASDLAKQKSTAFDITSSINVDVDKETVVLPDFKANLLGTEVNANLTANDIHEDEPSAKGSITAKGSNLPLILKLAGQFQGKDSALIRLANDLANSKDKSFDISTEFDADLEDGTAEIPKLNARLLGADIQGQFSADELDDDDPVMKGQLQAKGPDLPSLLQLVGNLQGEDSALLGFGQQLAKSKNKAFDIDTTFDLNPGAGKMEVSKLAANALGLAINGNLSSNKNAMDGRFKVGGKDIKGLLSALGQADLAEVMQALDIDVGIKGKQDDFQLNPLKVDATLSGKQIPNSPVHLVMTGDTRANLKQQTASVKNLSVQGLGLDLKGNLNFSELDEDAKFNGDLAIAPFNLRSFMRQLNQPAPKTADKNVLKNFALSSQLSGSSNSLALNGLTITLDETKLKGDIDIKNFDAPAVKFGVDVDQLNADRYLPAESQTTVTPEAAAAGAATLPTELLRSLNINGNLAIGQLIYSNLKMKGVKLSLKASDGVLEFSPASAQLYEGEYQGDIRLNAKGKTPKLNMKTQFKNILVEPLLTDLSGEASITGKGNISLDLNSSGADVSTLQHTLAGQGEFALEDGVFKGVDIPKILQDVEIKIENKDILGLKNIPEGGETPFDSVTGTLQINTGVIRNEDLMLKAPGFAVAGTGTVMNLADQTWKYDLVVEASEERLEKGEQAYNVGGHRIPIACRGKIADQNCKPDAGKIIAAVGSKQVERELGKFLDKLSGKEEAPAETAPSTEAPAEGAPAGDAENLQPDAAPEPKKDPVEKILDKALDKLF